MLMLLTSCLTLMPVHCHPAHHHHAHALNQLPDTRASSVSAVGESACPAAGEPACPAAPPSWPCPALLTDEDVPPGYETPEQVSHFACASTHSSVSGASCLICLLYSLAWWHCFRTGQCLPAYHRLYHALDQLPDTDASSVPAVPGPEGKDRGTIPGCPAAPTPWPALSLLR